MSSLTLTLHNSPTDRQLLLSEMPPARDLFFSTNEHGFAALMAFLPGRLVNSFFLYDRPGLPHVHVGRNGATAWEGRLEDVTIVPGGALLGAFGYWRALYDAPYTALWSTTSVADFRPVTGDDSGGRTPAKYNFDFFNRIFIGLTKDSIYTNNSDDGDVILQLPNGSDRGIQFVSFDFNVTLPTNWVAEARVINDDFSSPVAIWTVTGNGASQTGSQSGTTSSRTGLAFKVVNSTGASYTYAGETGANFLKITSLRLNGDNASTVIASSIANRLIQFVNSINSSQLQNVTGLVQSPGLDLRDELYEDALPADILTRLAALGDDQIPPRQWEVGVWENRILHFRPKGDAARTRIWYVDITELELERTLELLRNSVYASYQDVDGRTLRTAIAVNQPAIDRYDLTRRAVVDVSTTSLTQANVHRDAYLEDGREPKSKASIRFDRLYDASGTAWPNWAARAGDTFTIRNLSPVLSAAIDRVRSFRCSQTEYDADRDVLEVTPEAPLATLDTLLVRTAAGVKTKTAGQGRPPIIWT